MFRISRAFGALFVVGVFAPVAPAQPPTPVSPVSRPAYSPYLNLVRRDAAPGINYYGLVRPQLATQNNLQMLQQQIATTQQQIAGQALVNSTLPITGQQTFFLNTGGYFLNSRAGIGPTNLTVATRGGPTTTVRPPSRR
ncbi:MAG: hypothetical protein JWO38_5530 [Gemmataceae bacterium]|nr:hypothetical protein [Gemmataceae bacterium]